MARSTAIEGGGAVGKFQQWASHVDVAKRLGCARITFTRLMQWLRQTGQRSDRPTTSSHAPWRSLHPGITPEKLHRNSDVHGGYSSGTPDPLTDRLQETTTVRYPATWSLPRTVPDASTPEQQTDLGQASSTLATAGLGTCSIFWWQQIPNLQKRWTAACIPKIW